MTHRALAPQSTIDVEAVPRVPSYIGSDAPEAALPIFHIKRDTILLGKFVVHDLTLDVAPSNTERNVNRPGVYVFWKEGHGVIKVGKSQDNSKARALEHIRDNTKNERFEMSVLANDSTCHLLLFNVPRDTDLHWVLSLEAFFEWNLKPLIPSGRTG